MSEPRNSARWKRDRRNSKWRRNLRNRLAEAQNWRCAFCHGSLKPETVTTEHIWPLALGGPDSWENKVAACYPCNYKRSKRQRWRLHVDRAHYATALPIHGGSA